MGYLTPQEVVKRYQKAAAKTDGTARDTISMIINTVVVPRNKGYTIDVDNNEYKAS
jgi:hypothetical protein